ncbi:hypothetical protein FQN50_005953 [Emmonsiellopsis sp. PD_5]|nr:hypothetical protein FQN50_005953 [Emmonsiellopsis sp. PD_5]
MYYATLVSVKILACFLFSIVNASFPPVDLGYAVHVPTTVNSTSSGLSYANYDNIRFAHPPLGPLRFRKPKTPPPKQDGIQNGSAPLFSRDCVAAVPVQFSVPGLEGAAWGNEDCLFLNVRVPEGIKEGEKVPVFHWLYGGAYVLGSKDPVFGDHLGLYNDLQLPGQKFISVVSNYRLGLYGWASSASEDMDANVGLHDAVAALEWTQQYISKFGGDPEQVTVAGASAGAGLATLMLFGNGGEGKLPFQKAFISSPGLSPRRNSTIRDAIYDGVLNATNCDSLDCLRNASEETLFEANKYLVINTTSPVGKGSSPGFFPVVDGDYIPDLIPVLAREGRFNKGVEQVISSNMVNEWQTLSSNEFKMPSEFPNLVRQIIPNADDATVERIKSLYECSDNEPQQLAREFRSDTEFNCNAYNIAEAYKYRAKHYFMSIPPATHGQDGFYYFYNNNSNSNPSTPMKNAQLARELEEYFRRLITRSNNTRDFAELPDWPVYGDGKRSFDLALEGIKVSRNRWERCETLNELIGDAKNGA